MKRFIIIMAALLTFAGISAQAAEPVISPDGTYMFERRDTCDLYLDVYYPAKGSQTSIDGK